MLCRAQKFSLGALPPKIPLKGLRAPPRPPTSLVLATLTCCLLRLLFRQLFLPLGSCLIMSTASTSKTKTKLCRKKLTNALVHLDIFTGIKQIATTMQQIYTINEDYTSQNNYKCFSKKQPIMLSILKSGMLWANFKYDVFLTPGYWNTTTNISTQ